MRLEYALVSLLFLTAFGALLAINDKATVPLPQPQLVPMPEVTIETVEVVLIEPVAKPEPKPRAKQPVEQDQPAKPVKLVDLIDDQPQVKAKGNTPRRIEVSIFEQRLRAYEDDQLIYEFVCSTSSTGHVVGTDTNPNEPHDHVGVFDVMEKDIDKFSNTYQVPMPFALRYFGGHYIHATHGAEEIAKLGTPASHGCVRLSPQDAETLFTWAKVGDTIIVSR